MTDVALLYTINVINEEIMSLPNGSWKKNNKRYKRHERVISLQIHTTKRLHNDIVSLVNTYIHTYISMQTQSGDHAIMQSYNGTETSHEP